MRQRLISLDSVEITVIDEADHMADLGFLPGVTRILAATPAVGSDCCSRRPWTTGWTNW
jgi:superfamily II DNA/RNA helicase